MRCKACGADLPEDASFCIQCGVHLDTGMRADGDAPDSAVYPLLAAANLFRMRGSWDAAEQKCIEVLRLYPNNATAHSLLGDIYANQGRWEEALQWYQLAGDLDPDNKGDQVKAAQAKMRLAGSGTVSPEPAQSSGKPSFSWGKYSPPLQLAVVALVTFVFIMGLFALHTRRAKQEASPITNNPSFGMALPGNENFPAAQTPQTETPAVATNEAANAPAQATGNIPAANTPVKQVSDNKQAVENVIPQASGPDASEAEARTLARLQSQYPLVSRNGQAHITTVTWDPLASRAMVTIVFARNLAPAALRDEALRAAYRTGQGLSRIGIPRFEVLAKAPLTGSHGVSLVFAAEVANAQPNAWSANPDAVRPEMLMPVFSNLWWAPQLK
ncbi:MAG TPA: tetratricopeptide repeat protein [Armatimonadota bacterium]|nr:tetratricopeptide repeat protein [Armatimonadota bacterium]